MVSWKSSGDFGNFFQLFKISFIFNYWRITNAITRFKALFARELTCIKYICVCIQFKVREEGRLGRSEPFDFRGGGGGGGGYSWKMLKK